MAGREMARGDRKADLVVQLARRRDVAVLLNVEPQTGLAQRCGATLRSFGAGDNCNPGISGCAGRAFRVCQLRAAVHPLLQAVLQRGLADGDSGELDRGDHP